jgi:hypothetical protein
VQVSGTDKLNQLAEQQVISAIDLELGRKGLTKTEGDKADMFIAYQAAIGQRSNSRRTTATGATAQDGAEDGTEGWVPQ